MISFSNEQVKRFIVGMVIFTIFYIILLIKKRKEDLKLICIILGIRSCIAYSVCFIFVATGVSILDYMIKTNTFHIAGLFIVLVWFFIVFKGMTIILKQDFDIKDEEKKKLNKNIEKLLPEIAMYGLALACLLFMGVVFCAAYTCMNNIFQCISLVIVGSLFFGTPAIMIIFVKIKSLINRKDKK